MIVGLDVSTSFVGVAVIRTDPLLLPKDRIVLLDHLDFRGCASLMAKTDRLRSWLHDLARGLHCVSCVVIEDAAKRYASGRSSSTTIGTLIRFNGLATYIAYDAFDVHPRYISAVAARRLCGIKVKSRCKTGLSQKEQAFNTMMATELSHVSWPVKKNGDVVPWAYDIVDAYVIARSEDAGKSVPA